MATSKTTSALLLMMLLVVALPGTAQAARGLLQERGDRPTSPRTDRPDTYTTEDDCVEAKFEWDAENEACVGRHPRVDSRGTAAEGRPRREQKPQDTRPSDADDADTNGRSLLQRDPRRGPPPFTFTSEVDCVEAGFVWDADSQRCIPEAIQDDVEQPFQYVTEEACAAAGFEWVAEYGACVGSFPPADGHGPPRRQEPPQGSRPSNAADNGRSLLQRDSRRGPPPFTYTIEADCVEAGFVWEADSQRCIPEDIKEGADQPFQYVTEEACVAAGFEWVAEYGACVGSFPPADGHGPPRRQEPPQGSRPRNAADNGRSLLQRDPRRAPPPFTFNTEVDCVEAGFVWEAVSQRCIPEDIKEGVDQPFQYGTEEDCVAAEFEWDAEHDACVGKRPPRESTDGSNTTGSRPPMRQGRGGRSLLKHQ